MTGSFLQTKIPKSTSSTERSLQIKNLHFSYGFIGNTAQHSMRGNLNQENIFTRTSYVCAFAVVSTKSLIQQNVKAEIWFSHPNTSTRILVYVAASFTLLSRLPRNMSFYKCMLNEKLDFEIVYRKFRVGKGEKEVKGWWEVCVCVLSLVEFKIKLKTFISRSDVEA